VPADVMDFASRSIGGSQRAVGSDCLAKTQDYAKPQGDVYGLTPARCRKRRASAREKTKGSEEKKSDKNRKEVQEDKESVKINITDHSQHDFENLNNQSGIAPIDPEEGSSAKIKRI